MTPYEATYGQQPPLVVSYLLGTFRVHAMDSILYNQESILHILKENLAIKISHWAIGKPTSLRMFLWIRGLGVFLFPTI